MPIFVINNIIMTQNDKYIFFWNGPFSNWDWVDFTYKGHMFANSEQAYMWEKANYFGDTEIAEAILKTPDPRKNKALGRMVENFNGDEWMNVCYDIMYEVCKAKFTQSSYHKKQLEKSHPKTLVEASPYDRIWGIGFGEVEALESSEEEWGMNLLGKVLTQLREDIL